MNIESIILPHILGLKPYSSARDEFKGKEGVFLDANENALGSGLPTAYNRYPDPMAWEIKTQLAEIKHCQKEQIFLGNGSDEAIDLLIRMTCRPGQDAVLICPPTYGMYEVSANINQAKAITVPLDANFDLDLPKIKAALSPELKLLFLCSPNNPTGNKLSRARIVELLDHYQHGLVVVDEAYIDFSDEPSFISELEHYPHLVVLQTLSKAYGLAGLRLGMAFASSFLIGLLNKIKPPYNINAATQTLVQQALGAKDFVKKSIEVLNTQKNALISELNGISGVKTIYPSHANFILVVFDRADDLFDYLIQHQVITRSRTKLSQCEGSIRITIGTESENQALLASINAFYAQ